MYKRQVQDSDQDPDLDDLDNYNEYLYNTDPHVSDTDADGLFDGAEVLTYNTNPLLNDTDGDGYLDGEEVAAGSDPLNKFSIPGSGPSGSSKWWISLIVVGILVVLGSTFYTLSKRGIISLGRKPEIEITSTEETSKELTCYYCGYPLEDEVKVCSECKKERLHCAVCKLPITFGEAVGKCSLCEVQGHLTHMQEWIKTQGKCPVCQQSLPLEGIVPESELDIKKKKK